MQKNELKILPAKMVGVLSWQPGLQAGWVELLLLCIKVWSNYKWNKTWKYEYTTDKYTESNMQYGHNDPSWNVPNSQENMAANGPTSPHKTDVGPASA